MACFIYTLALLTENTYSTTVKDILVGNIVLFIQLHLSNYCAAVSEMKILVNNIVKIGLWFKVQINDNNCRAQLLMINQYCI